MSLPVNKLKQIHVYVIHVVSHLMNYQIQLYLPTFFFFYKFTFSIFKVWWLKANLSLVKCHDWFFVLKFFWQIWHWLNYLAPDCFSFIAPPSYVRSCFKTLVVASVNIIVHAWSLFTFILIFFIIFIFYCKIFVSKFVTQTLCWKKFLSLYLMIRENFLKVSGSFLKHS